MSDLVRPAAPIVAKSRHSLAGRPRLRLSPSRGQSLLVPRSAESFMRARWRPPTMSSSSMVIWVWPGAVCTGATSALIMSPARVRGGPSWRPSGRFLLGDQRVVERPGTGAPGRSPAGQLVEQLARTGARTRNRSSAGAPAAPRPPRLAAGAARPPAPSPPAAPRPRLGATAPPALGPAPSPSAPARPFRRRSQGQQPHHLRPLPGRRTRKRM